MIPYLIKYNLAKDRIKEPLRKSHIETSDLRGEKEKGRGQKGQNRLLWPRSLF